MPILCPKGMCRYDERVNEFLQRAFEYDGFVFAAPVHFAHAASSMSAFLDRALFADQQSHLNLFVHKVADEVGRDEEGVQIMRVLGKNLAGVLIS